MKKIVILDNIRSAHNVGSIFRTADGAGVFKIYLCGYTPTPIDRFGRTQPEITKTSLGASESVDWEHREDIGELIGELRGDGVAIAAVEQSENSISYQDFRMEKDTAFIFGNEIDGVQEKAINLSDVILEIPMLGKKESLNVGVSAGIVLFNIVRTLN